MSLELGGTPALADSVRVNAQKDPDLGCASPKRARRLEHPPARHPALVHSCRRVYNPSLCWCVAPSIPPSTVFANRHGADRLFAVLRFSLRPSPFFADVGCFHLGSPASALRHRLDQGNRLVLSHQLRRCAYAPRYASLCTPIVFLPCPPK